VRRLSGGKGGQAAYASKMCHVVTSSFDLQTLRF
jgi:hypothetical protein